MTANNRLLQALSLAKYIYLTSKNETSARANPPEGQNINKRILKRLIDETGEVWRTYYEAFSAFIDQGTFAEEDERERYRDQLNRSSIPWRWQTTLLFSKASPPPRSS